MSDSQPPTANMSPSADSIVGDFSSKASWLSPGGGSPPTGLAGGAYTIGPMRGVISAESLAVQPGEIFVIDYSVRLIKAPKNGKPAVYVVGPMFMDIGGKVLSWGAIEPALTEQQRHSRVEVIPPAGAVRVWLYLGGLWAAEDPLPDGLLAYSRAALEVMKPSRPTI